MSTAPSLVLSSQGRQQILTAWNLPSSTSINVIKQSENHTYLVQVFPLVTTTTTNESSSNDDHATTIRTESSVVPKKKELNLLPHHEHEEQQPPLLYILRLTPKHHRSQEAIQAELDFIHRIHHVLEHDDTPPRPSSSLHVCPPIPLKKSLESSCFHETYSRQQNNTLPFIATLVSPYHDCPNIDHMNETNAQEYYYAVLFEYAQGSSVLEKWIGLTNESFIDALGRAIGEMHDISQKMNNRSETSWQVTAENIPQWYDTHGGACNIEKIRERANQYAHEPSLLLLSLWENHGLKEFISGLKKTRENFGVIHGDINVSNYFAAEKTSEQAHAQVWIFDFDQVQHNFFGCDLAVVLQMIRFFEDDGLGIGKIEGFDADRFRTVFLQAYKETCPHGMIEEGHLDTHHLKHFEMFREFYHTSVAVDILFRHEHASQGDDSTGQPMVQFEESIISFCKLAVNRLQNKFKL
ncbi:hypothetical protein C9374_006934 [Naegleria lovaniensis]|uniref:Aminoglycoside phosphotransferase domain-containing protein n=1 Tax=Naegleria lovaniensis TaxID=51637 RepID=A0AA88H2J5_NAELO|nr:uncharacterized protein C9374_006934 [Naegleria lovaniensis]KAG2393403.1 hypothetical protein C9374_006934 [Naegleria lovaniensis]